MLRMSSSLLFSSRWSRYDGSGSFLRSMHSRRLLVFELRNGLVDERLWNRRAIGCRCLANRKRHYHHVWPLGSSRVHRHLIRLSSSWRQIHCFCFVGHRRPTGICLYEVEVTLSRFLLFELRPGHRPRSPQACARKIARRWFFRSGFVPRRDETDTPRETCILTDLPLTPTV